MKLAVCTAQAEEQARLCEWIEQYCRLRSLPAAVVCISTPQELSRQAPGAIQIAYIGFGSSTGFLAARALQERDRACRIILMDDTTQYAIQGLHLYFADFILRPVEFRHVARSMRLALERF